MTSAEATCTWGEGPPVLVTVNRENVSGFAWSAHGKDAAEGSFGLTIDEALALAAQLNAAAVAAAKLDAGYMEAGRPKPSLEALKLAAMDCGVNTNNPDTCGVCHKHFADCEDDLNCVGDEYAPGSDIPLGREFACPGARVRVALTLRPPRSRNQGAVSLVLDPEKRKLLAVWNRRAQGWSLPGGKREPSETLEDTQARELREEAGVDTVTATFIYDAPTVAPDSDRHIYVFLVTFKGTPKPSERAADGELCPVKWMTKEEFLTPGVCPFREFYVPMFDMLPDVMVG